jgi:hypothetical protein
MRIPKRQLKQAPKLGKPRALAIRQAARLGNAGCRIGCTSSRQPVHDTVLSGAA